MRARLFTAALLLLLACSQARAASISVLYKRDSDTSVVRTDPAAQAVLQALEDKLLEQGLEVLQPAAELCAKLDAARGLILTFSGDAGLTMTVDVSKGLRPNPGADSTWAEIRMRAKVYSGPRVLASLSGFGAVAFRGAAQERAYEGAAKRAVDDIADRLQARLAAEPAPPAPPQLTVPATAPPPAVVKQSAGVKWALLVGVSDFTHAEGGESGERNLQGVTVDMQTMARALKGFGVEQERMTTLYDAAATTKAVRDALRALQLSTRPDDLVYLYFSTHGIPKAEGYSRFGIPVTYDFRRNNYIDFEEIRSALAAMPARGIIWINDTCHSGLAAQGMLTVEVGSRDFSITSPGAFDVSRAAAVKADKDIAVISSASGDQKAGELKKEGGLFSSVFARGAREASASGRPVGVYSFYKQYIDGKVQALFRETCAREPHFDFCPQGTQQPVFGAQKDGKSLGM